jgi:hypothetical protein
MFGKSVILLSRGSMMKAAMKGHRLQKDIVRQFLDSSYRIWGPTFDYSIVEYKHPNVPVKVVCKQHGAFLVSPREHLYMHRGCPDCSTERRVRKKQTQMALPPSPNLKEFMQKLSPGRVPAKQIKGDENKGDGGNSLE